ncbi:hypothetical protein IP84_11355 [beta proteobacterium AAP99]|nr:hypothetical protein IP84_11355 [beta proteobacterium AAP99]
MISAFVQDEHGADLVELTGLLRTRVVQVELAELAQTTASSPRVADAQAALESQLAHVRGAMRALDVSELNTRLDAWESRWRSLSATPAAAASGLNQARATEYVALLDEANSLTKAVAHHLDLRESANRRIQWLAALAFLLCAATWFWQISRSHSRTTRSAKRVLEQLNQELSRNREHAHPRSISEGMEGMDAGTAAQLKQLVGSLEAILGESEQRWRIRAQLSSDYYWETDEHHRLTYVTSGFEDKFFHPDDMIGKTRWELSPLSLTPAQWAQHQRDLDEHLPFRGLELCKYDSDGSPAWASIAGEPRFDAHGRFLGYQGVGRDISERKRREQQLQRYNAELEQQVRQRTQALSLAYTDMEGFVRNVAHDLRTPLSQVRSLIGLARAQAIAVPPGRTNFLGLAEQQADITLEMLEALLELARASSSPVQPTPVHLRTLVESCVATLQQPNPARPVDWHFSCEHTVMTDPSLLRLALMNLMSNAVKFSASATQPCVSVLSSVRPDGTIEIHIVDNGVGFDDSQASRLFKPFSRLHLGTEFSGTGIGLSVVSKVMERLGGRVGAESTPGLGARFTLGLPADALVADSVRPIRRAVAASAIADPARV